MRLEVALMAGPPHLGDACARGERLVGGPLLLYHRVDVVSAGFWFVSLKDVLGFPVFYLLVDTPMAYA